MTNANDKRDVLLHYDEESQELVFYTVPVSATVAIRRSEFGGIRPPVGLLQRLPAKEALTRIGGTVIGLLDLSSGKKIGLADGINLPPIDDLEA